MSTVMALLISILGVGGTGGTADGVGGTGHGAVFDANGPAPAMSMTEYDVGM